MKTLLLAVAAGLAATAAQPPPASPDAPAFEVASIKPNHSGDGRVRMQNQPGRYTASNVTLRLLIRNAYQLQDFQITGGPGWLNDDHFDINAKVPDGTPPSGPPVPGAGPSRLQLMVRSLLAERFSSSATTRKRVPRTAATAIGVRTSNRAPDAERFCTLASTRPFFRLKSASDVGTSADFFTLSTDSVLPG